LFGRNSGVSWGSWTEWESIVGKAPMLGGKKYAKNQPGHRLTPFKFCRSHIFGRNAERKNREETRSRYGATDFSVFIPFVFV